MPENGAIQVEGTVVETLPNVLFRVELSNGHRVLAHAPARKRMQFASLGLGDRVTLELSPYDLSSGRILK